MWKSIFFLVLCCLLTPSLAIWQCSNDEDCGSLLGSVCAAGACACSSSQQIVAGGTLCADYAPYYTSTCVDDFQCSRLFTTYHCRRNEDESAGSCFCQPGNHYYLGRCWPSSEQHQPCSRDEECMGVIRDPFSMVCDGTLETCQCAEGYYSRQRGECRRIATALGERCVLDEDCQFANGACHPRDFICYDPTTTIPGSLGTPCAEDSDCLPDLELQCVLTSGEGTCMCNDGHIVSEGMCIPSEIVSPSHVTRNAIHKMADTKTPQVSNNATVKMTGISRQDGAACSTTPCSAPFECSSWGHCVCPLGYYASADGSVCLAELGSPSTEEQCVGLLTVVENGRCGCPANFFFDENMRDCVKVARFMTDFCLNDVQCHTFGAAAYCGAPELWGLRSCECDLELAVWDAQRSMCRLFAGIGEACQVDSDCMAGEFEIQCALNDEGEGYCACPDGLTAFEGLCLSSDLEQSLNVDGEGLSSCACLDGLTAFEGLSLSSINQNVFLYHVGGKQAYSPPDELGDACQLTQECTGAANAVCEAGRCSCDNGYQQVDDFCAPIIGGTCSVDTDCVIENTACVAGNSGFTCQCLEEYVEYSDECWELSSGYNGNCTVDAQCFDSLGSGSACIDGVCLCGSSFHYRDDSCWPVTGLFETCSRSSQCYLGELTDTVVCRNGLCQCDFNYPYSEDLNTCISSATVLRNSSFIVITLLAYLFS